MPAHPPLYRVTAFSLAGPQSLRVSFSDGLSRIIDFRPFLKGELYEPLRETRLFEQVALDPEVHTLVWPNGADFDPATLHDWPAEAAEIASAVEHWETNAKIPPVRDF